MGSGAVLISFYVVCAVEKHLCLVILVNLQFEYGVSDYSASQVRYTSKTDNTHILLYKKYLFSSF